MLKIRSIWKATELKRFKELERKYHYMGETHSGGDTLRLVIEDDGESLPFGASGSLLMCRKGGHEASAGLDGLYVQV